MFRKIFGYKKIVLYLVVVFVTALVTSAFYSPYNNYVDAVSYYYGARGQKIREVQTKLKAWGYYSGSVDGAYGYKTYSAVKKFQAKNGLRVDGVIGDNTLQALGIYVSKTTSSSAKYTTSNQDALLLSRLINGEARGEPYEGQVAVGAVILNRTRDPRFPSTIAGVVYQPGAFTATVDGQIHANIQQSSINAARDALNGWDPSGGAVYYFNPSTATNKWIWSRPLIKIIGKHRFCR